MFERITQLVRNIVAKQQLNAADIGVRLKGAVESRTEADCELRKAETACAGYAVSGNELMLARARKHREECRIRLEGCREDEATLLAMAQAAFDREAEAARLRQVQALDLALQQRVAHAKALDNWVRDGAQLVERLSESNQSVALAIRALPNSISDIPPCLVFRNVTHRLVLELFGATNGLFQFAGGMTIGNAYEARQLPNLEKTLIEERRRVMAQLPKMQQPTGPEAA